VSFLFIHICRLFRISYSDIFDDQNHEIQRDLCWTSKMQPPSNPLRAKELTCPSI
jgi:DNA-binding XRE family transcriptional regulator